MSITLSFRALQKWPKPQTVERRTAPFKSTYTKTIDLLEAELRHLDVTEAIIEADCDRSQVRLDVGLRADAKLRGPGIVLCFESKAGSMMLPCDTFTAWQDNLRAIALALEALRKIDRYGVTSSGEQYKGWLALPAPIEAGAFPDAEAAVNWMAREMGVSRDVIPVLPWDDVQKDFFRRSGISKFHPDRNTGDDSRWKLWQQAATILGIEI